MNLLCNQNRYRLANIDRAVHTTVCALFLYRIRSELEDILLLMYDEVYG